MDAKAMKLSPEGVYYFGTPYGIYSLWNTTYPISNVKRRIRDSEHGRPTLIPFTIKKLYTYRGEYTSTNTMNIGPIDVMQGGTHSALQDIIDELQMQLDAFEVLSSPIWHNRQGVSTFIPTVSALGFINTSFNWRTRIDDRDLVCSNEIPFDNYFIPKQNNEHVKLDVESARWAQEEILYGTPGCPYICATKINMVGGDRYLCTNTNFTFTLDVAVPSGAEVVWEYSEGLTEVSHTSNQIVLRYNTGSPTPEIRYVRAIIIPKTAGEPCGASKIIYKSLDYGEMFEYHYSTADAMHPKFTVKVEPHLAGSQYSWKKDATTPWESINGSNIRTYDKINLGDPLKYFHTRIFPSGCSESIPSVTLTGEYGVIGFEYAGSIEMRKKVSLDIGVTEITLIPNPTSDNWEVLLTSEFIDQNTIIKVYSIDGKLMNTINSFGKQIILVPAHQYLSGIYLIEVNINNQRTILKGIKK